MDIERIKGCTFAREMQLKAEDLSGDEVTFSFASEEPYDRWWGTEILSMADGAGDLARLNDGGAWLFNHDRNILLGSCVKAWLEKGKAYVTTRWSSRAEVQENFRKDFEDGHLRNVSFAYDYLEWVEARDTDELTVTRWRAYEVSAVTIPADPTVGVGRSDGRPLIVGAEAPKIYVPASFQNSEKMADEDPRFAFSVKQNEVQGMTEAVLTQEEQEARESSILAMAEKYLGDLPEKEKLGLVRDALKNEAMDEHAFRQTCYAKLYEHRAEATGFGTSGVDLTPKERREYSVVKLLRALDEKNPAIAPFEIEVSEAIYEKTGRDRRNEMTVIVPHDQLQANRNAFTPDASRATYEVQTANVGGVTVETSIYPSMIELLRNLPMCFQMGVQSWTGLEGNLDIIRQLTETTAAWRAEDIASTESNATFELIGLRPKDLSAYSRITRRMLQQSSIDIESFVRQELVTALVLGIDRAIVHGTGASNQPTGILNTGGIGAVALGTNGGAPTWASIVELETKVAVANAIMGNLGALTTPQARGKLKTTLKNNVAGADYIWMDSGQVTPSGQMGMLNGYKAGATNQIRADLTKGTGTNLSALVFGDWSQCVAGFWSGLELAVNPYGNDDFLKGAIKVLACQTVDIEVLRPSSFAAITDMITT